VRVVARQYHIEPSDVQTSPRRYERPGSKTPVYSSRIASSSSTRCSSFSIRSRKGATDCSIASATCALVAFVTCHQMLQANQRLAVLLAILSGRNFSGRHV
jgi:hypothetical protein